MDTMNEETITIPKKLYDELVDDQRLLDALRRGGVDCWDWYDDAIDAYNKMSEEEK